MCTITRFGVVEQNTCPHWWLMLVPMILFLQVSHHNRGDAYNHWTRHSRAKYPPSFKNSQREEHLIGDLCWSHRFYSSERPTTIGGEMRTKIFHTIIRFSVEQNTWPLIQNSQRDEHHIAWVALHPLATYVEQPTTIGGETQLAWVCIMLIGDLC